MTSSSSRERSSKKVLYELFLPPLLPPAFGADSIRLANGAGEDDVNFFNFVRGKASAVPLAVAASYSFLANMVRGEGGLPGLVFPA